MGDSFGDSYRLSELPSLFDQNLFKSFPPRPLDWMESSCNLHPDKAAATQTWNLSNILQPTQFQEFPAPAASTSSSSCSFIVFFSAAVEEKQLPVVELLDSDLCIVAYFQHGGNRGSGFD